MAIIFPIALFFLVLIIFWSAYSIFRQPETRAAKDLFDRYSVNEAEEEIDIIYNRKFSKIKILDRILKAIPGLETLDNLMQQSGVKMLVGKFVFLTFNVSVACYLITLFTTHSRWLPTVLAAVGIIIPYLCLLFLRRRRYAKFESLFPDALDLIGYSLKAGHSILASFKMVSEEIANPVGEEFARVVEEINFGQSTDSALRNFSQRIDSLELKFFVTSVIIQRETGGNLIEVFEKISDIIRNKFRFREKVKTLSAEARLSANILLVLPFFVGAAIFTINPSYINVLQTDPAGPYLLAIGLGMMTIGALIIYRMVQLDV